MADWHGVMSKNSGNLGRDEDFNEEEVWSYVKEKEDLSPTPTPRKLPRESSSSSNSSSSSSAWRLPSKPRMIRRVSNSAISHETKVVHQQSSAPVKIPDWSKIYGKHANIMESSSSSSSSWVENNNGDSQDGYGEDDDDDDDIVPPHEWLARKLARSQISSFSVCEGMGRTLKGRDLSKVRNAVLTKTGFLE
ncbi:Senescence regulator [Corchorus olitorius]|uniref:Senescence regulator n=1 Tax=Corchorus olitorius TaxID=93759 RepID=A0A1R3H3N4_9ROSI|nr:Senescence regulator [Corchorus olitorius]